MLIWHLKKKSEIRTLTFFFSPEYQIEKKKKKMDPISHISKNW